MDFQNKYFQQFLRMKDSEVEKLLSGHLMAAKYYKYNEISKKVGRCKTRIFLDDGYTLSNNDLQYYRYKFSDYKEDREDYKKSFFKNIGFEPTLKFIERKCKFYYGDDNVWVDADKIQGDVIIRFPEIEITNSLEDSHILKDLYFKINVRKSGFHGVSMARTTVNECEFNRYIFSHLSSCRPGKYLSDLCLGDTEFNRDYHKAANGNDFRAIDRFIATIGGYLSWESIEGVPYKKFGDYKLPKIIEKNAYVGKYDSDWSINFQNAMNLVISSGIKLSYKTRSLSNGDTIITIENVHEIDDVLCNKIIPQFPRYNGRSYSSVSKSPIDFDAETYISQVRFNNETIPVKVEESDYDFCVPKMCHIELRDAVVRELEKELLNHLIEIDNE